MSKANVPTATIQAPDPGEATAALEKPIEKPKENEKRISTVTDSEMQIVEQLMSVVSSDDPKLLYTKIKGTRM
jgi:hypothetical protein